MKHIILIIAIFLVVSICTPILMLTHNTNDTGHSTTNNTTSPTASAEHIYTLSGIVSSIDNEYITIDTADGNGWVIDNTANTSDASNIYSVNDKVTITYDNMRTKTIYDDEIISITRD